MTAANFARAMPLEMKYEGGWSDNPSDPGGDTMEGVTLAIYSAYLGRQATPDELRNIPDSDRLAIYRNNFWNAVKADQLPSGVDLICFDAAIQHGPGRAIKFLQKAAAVTQDGIIGQGTLNAVNTAKPSDLIGYISAERESFYRSLSTFPTFGKGWLARLDDVTAQAHGWANGA